MENLKARKQRMQQAITKQQTSDISVTEFCKKHRIKESTFWYWRKKLASTADVSSSNNAACADKAEPQRFYPISLAGLSQSIEVYYPSGVSLKVPLSFEFEKLKQLLYIEVA